MKKVVIYLLPVLFLAACSNSSDSNSGKQGFRSEKLTPEVSKQFSSFIDSESELVSMIAVSMSNDNTINNDHAVGPAAPKEVKDHCILNTARNMVAKDISWATSELKGDDQCPLEVYQKVGVPRAGANVKEEWSNTYLVKSPEYQNEYGITQVIEKILIQAKTPPKDAGTPTTNLIKKETSFSLVSGEVVTVTYSYSWSSVKDVYETAVSQSLSMKGDVLRMEGAYHYEKDQNQSSIKFYFNDKEITEDEYRNAGGFYFQTFFW